jgi:hypothetical protein
MKAPIISLFLVFYQYFGLHAQNPNYPNNREPLLKSSYVKLPLGAVKPKGWIYDQLMVQANGLTGHLHDVWGIAHASGWKGDLGVNVSPECCFPRFFPRWLEGLIPLAYQLDDPKLKNLAYQIIDTLLTSMVEAKFPPRRDLARVTPSIVGWSHLGRVLQGYYEATGDKRAIELCKMILDYNFNVKDVKSASIVTPERQGMLLGFSWWYYNQSGSKETLNIIEQVSRKNIEDWTDYYANFKDRDKTAKSSYLDNPKDHGRHGVDVAQALQYPVAYYLMSKDEKYRKSIFQGLEYLDKYNGQVNGRWTADEYLAGVKPTQGTELCVIVESIYSLTKNFEALGDVSFIDRLEKMTFNALPGTCSGDFWSHQYVQLANQVSASDDNRRLYHGDNSTSNVFGFTPNYPCCLSNMHSGFPRFVENMWMATNDNGLISAAYGPSEVKAKCGNTDVTITEETRYPFSDEIQFKINLSHSSAFPLYFRIPEWASRAELTVDGKVQKPAKGTVHRVERQWKSGDVVSLKFNNKVRTETRFNKAASVSWGPLDFVLRIGQSFKQIDIPRDKPIKPLFATGVADWQIYPTTLWNYGLVIDRQNPKYTIEYGPISKMPFARKGEPVFLPGADGFTSWGEDVPMVLKMKARRVDNWVMNGPVAGDVPLVPVTSAKDTIIDLIPYGCTRLRISEFPVIDQKKK